MHYGRRNKARRARVVKPLSYTAPLEQWTFEYRCYIVLPRLSLPHQKTIRIRKRERNKCSGRDPAVRYDSLQLLFGDRYPMFVYHDHEEPSNYCPIAYGPLAALCKKQYIRPSLTANAFHHQLVCCSPLTLSCVPPLPDHSRTLFSVAISRTIISSQFF